MKKIAIAVAYMLLMAIFLGGAVNSVVSFFERIFYFGLVPGTVILSILIASVYVVGMHIKETEKKTK